MWTCATAMEPQATETLTSGIWEDKYGDKYGVMEHGMAELQGARRAGRIADIWKVLC